jgi:Predicted permeases
MNRLFDVLTVTLPVAAVFLLGYFSKRNGIVGDKALDGIKAIVMNFTLPAVLFSAFFTAQLDGGFFVVALTLFTSCVIALGAGFIIKRIFGSLGDLFPFLTTGFEAGMMGYGLYAMLFPPGELHYFAMVDLGQVLFVFTLYMAVLNKRKGKTTGQTIKAMLVSPVFLSIAAGLVFALSGLGAFLSQSAAGPAVEALLSYIGAPTGMLMIFVVGCGLSFDRASIKKAMISVALRTGIMVLLCAACLLILGSFIALPAPLWWAVILMFSLPAPFVLPVFTSEKNQSAYLSSVLSFGAVLSLVIFAVISALI